MCQHSLRGRIEGNPLEDIELTRAIVRIFRNGVEVSRALPAALSEGSRR
jgi:hypothetical protein